MNDSSNTTPGAPEPQDTGDERTTPSSTAAHEAAQNAATEEFAAQDAQPTVPQPTAEPSGVVQAEQDGAEQPTREYPAAADQGSEQPTAHTLPHRTGPTPAHYVSGTPADGTSAGSANRSEQDPAAQMGQDGYATQYGAQQYLQNGAQQAYDPYGRPIVPGQPAGQTPYPGQTPYGVGPAAAGQPPYAGQQPYGGQQPYANQQPYGGQAPYGYGQVPPAFAQPKRRPKRWMTITGAVAAGVIIAGAAGGGAFALGHATGEQAASAAGQSQTLQIPNGSGGSGSSGGTYGYGQGGTGTFGGTQGGSGSSSGTGTVPSDATAATATEKQGLVTIVSTLDYDESSKSAGTGMIMTSNGEILTNNHVVQGATSIQVTVVSTGKTYTADVVGTDSTHDVAVLKLQGASGLTPVSFGKTAKVATGDSIHSTGNAEGTGSLVTAKGTVTATKQSITVQSESGSGTESLTNLIEISADVVSGDSGGPSATPTEKSSASSRLRRPAPRTSPATPSRSPAR
ncbi:hypothetical protein GCM10025867_26530 [Frondihabitans sucicola]|uniref:Trypsin-like serine protease n=1 Tax=Frondihabitans sucicola TaxID=1268041 RepID=A0ABM8GPN6_9MICO|nr:trypsin-like peptidase domain-containing protein [Frondihabitans sucicola]BDZ50412.1 hypothetical protein GCM10025867_26530 [Frondihabitans sucicola]